MNLQRGKIFLCLLLAFSILSGEAAASAPQSPASAAPELAKPPDPSSVPQTPAPPSPSKAEVLSNRIVEYHLDVSLEEGGILQGKETITWKHPGRKPVNELYFHMYPNAFASPQTTFMKETGGRLRNDTMPENGYGSITVKEMKTEDGLPLMHRTQFVQPDDGNTADQTLMKVRLPRPVKEGESITLYMTFEVKLPKIFARMGHAGDFVMAGQWFPKISVYEPAGRRDRAEEGWNLHQYHGNSEFYADFGIYSVRIQVPDAYTVAATGFPTRAPVSKGGRKTYQFYADDVHDFAWAASPHFVTYEEPFSTAEVPGVKIKLYMDASHKDLQARYMYAAKAALANYSKWYGPYPYSTLSIVVPPQNASGAGGMEYPTLVTGVGADDADPGYNLERTVVHEIAHQYFYGIVASNEFEEPWLDEGFTSYAEDKLMEQEYGLIPNIPLQSGQVYSPESLTREAWKYSSPDHYAQNAYLRGKLVLLGIEQQLGSNKMEALLRSYVRKYRFKHPSTRDFQRVVENITDQSWSHYFNQYVYGSQMADFAVDSITLRKLENGMYESAVTVSKKGGDVPAVPIQIMFKDKSSLQKTWNGQQQKITYRVQSRSPAESVVIDPLYTLALENNHLNNTLLAELPEKTETRWLLGITRLAEALIGSLSW
ncbi:M1 family metallopeptidase [Paenibacillus sp. P96]|uniref:M1 family metallopeptidase n=1 Tax=Paenibacillus zeirhizosphaerae TaxID=2987519 RepID=A0ABT9FX75_9BACL|nr:M1 family metallopeptidase [Paenibacillus sp. P96]MDP4099234.1 M1 family metallopeptidase [Paenibacillus sp. P96]